jgi:hypothetical protein
MQDGDIDYSRYTLRELEEALSGIDRHHYPKNHSNLCAAYQQLTARLPEAGPSEHTSGPAEPEDDWTGPRYDENGRYIANHIPPGERTGHIVMSLLLLAYGSYGVWANDLYIPGKRSRGMHLHDVPAWIMYAAMVCACLVMFSVVIDHYDRRDNERRYRAVAAIGEFVGCSLFVVSLLWAIFER